MFQVGDLVKWNYPTIVSSLNRSFTKERAWYGVIIVVEQKKDFICIEWFNPSHNEINPMSYNIRWCENNIVRV